MNFTFRGPNSSIITTSNTGQTMQYKLCMYFIYFSSWPKHVGENKNNECIEFV